MFELKKTINSQMPNKNETMLTDQQLQELHVFLAEMLKDIVSLCDKYKLRYSMGGGSCLGTVRHKGFIPWDDDLDINMPRKDYEKFSKVFKRELGDRYILNAPNYSDKVIARFPKVLAKNTEYVTKGFRQDPEFEKVFIDIFIMENVPNNKLIRFIKGSYVNALEFIAGQVLIHNAGKNNKDSVIEIIGTKNYFFRNAIGFIFSWKSYTKWCNSIDRIVRHSNERSKFVCFPTGRKHYFGEIIRRGTILPFKKMKFESIEVSVPNDYKRYLSNLYGDNYMKLPPVEKREKHSVISFKI